MSNRNDGMTLVTGAAGFIGFHVARRLLADGLAVVGADNLNDYYDVRLKEARLEILFRHEAFHFRRIDLADRARTAQLFAENPIRRVVHLAAQAGVRYSLVNPQAYTDSNLVAFVNILEGCRAKTVEHLAFASSSSVYGGNTRLPFTVHDNVDHPVSLYAATKRANELMAHSYAHLYRIPCTAMRLFTAYGPWGRPDMALFGFTRAILNGDPIDVYNNGHMTRDFTYIDDIVESAVRLLERPATPDPNWHCKTSNAATSFAPFRVYNLGNQSPVELLAFIEILEKALGKTAVKRFSALQPGDLVDTHASMDETISAIGFHSATPIEKGIQHFVDWYRDYYRVQ